MAERPYNEDNLTWSCYTASATNEVFTNKHAKTDPIIKTKRYKFKRANWIKSHKRAEGETDLETFFILTMLKMRLSKVSGKQIIQHTEELILEGYKQRHPPIIAGLVMLFRFQKRI